MKPNTYSIYSSEFRDSHKDSNIAKSSFSKNTYNEKSNSNLPNNNSNTKISKTALQMPHTNLMEANKMISNFMSPMSSPKSDLTNFTLQKTVIPSSKLNTNDNTLLRNIIDKKQNLQKVLQNSSNMSSTKLLVARQSLNETKSVKTITQNTLITKESNALTVGMNTSFKKTTAGINSTANIPHSSSVQQKRNMLLDNENSLYNNKNMDNHGEKSAYKSNPTTEYSPNKQINDIKNLKNKDDDDDHIRKAYQSYSPPGHIEIEKKYDLLRNPSKGNSSSISDPIFQKQTLQFTKNYISSLQDDPNEKVTYNAGKSGLNKEFYSEPHITLYKSPANLINNSNSKKSTSKLGPNRERTLSPTVEAVIYSRLNEKQSHGLSTMKEASIDRSKRLAYDAESFDDSSSIKDKFREKKSVDYEEKRYKTLKLNEKDDETLKAKDKENIKLFNNSNQLGNNLTNTQFKNPNALTIYTGLKETKLNVKPDKNGPLKNSNTISLDIDIQAGISSPKNQTSTKDYRFSEDIRQSLQLNADSLNLDYNRMKSLQQKDSVHSFLAEKQKSQLSEQGYQELSNKYDNERFLEKTGSIHLIKNPNKTVAEKVFAEKVYAETSKSKEAKRFELPFKVSDNGKPREKDSSLFNSVSGSIGFKDLKTNYAKPEISNKETYLESQSSGTKKEDESYNNYKAIRSKKIGSDDEYISGDSNVKKGSIDYNEKTQGKDMKYGNDNRGLAMTKAYEKMKELLESQRLKEKKWAEEKDRLHNELIMIEKDWNDEKILLINTLESLQQRLNLYEKKF